MNLTRFHKILVLGGALAAAAACGPAPTDDETPSPDDQELVAVADAGSDGADAGEVFTADAGEPVGNACPWAGADPCFC